MCIRDRFWNFCGLQLPLIEPMRSKFQRPEPNFKKSATYIQIWIYEMYIHSWIASLPSHFWENELGDETNLIITFNELSICLCSLHVSLEGMLYLLKKLVIKYYICITRFPRQITNSSTLVLILRSMNGFSSFLQALTPILWSFMKFGIQYSNLDDYEAFPATGPVIWAQILLMKLPWNLEGMLYLPKNLIRHAMSCTEFPTKFLKKPVSYRVLNIILFWNIISAIYRNIISAIYRNIISAMYTSTDLNHEL